MDKKILKIFSIMLAVLLNIISLVISHIYQNLTVEYNDVSVDYSTRTILIMINLFILIYFIICKNTRKIIIGIVIMTIYIIISFFIPIYDLMRTSVPTGPNSYLMGLALETSTRDIYWIELKSIK